MARPTGKMIIPKVRRSCGSCTIAVMVWSMKGLFTTMAAAMATRNRPINLAMKTVRGDILTSIRCEDWGIRSVDINVRSSLRPVRCVEGRPCQPSLVESGAPHGRSVRSMRQRGKTGQNAKGRRQIRERGLPARNSSSRCPPLFHLPFKELRAGSPDALATRRSGAKRRFQRQRAGGRCQSRSGRPRARACSVCLGDRLIVSPPRQRHVQKAGCSGRRRPRVARRSAPC